MQSVPSHSGDLSQDSAQASVHPKTVSEAADPIARTTRRAYNGLSASSVGLELGIAVVLGLVFGMWLDGVLGTRPWMMLLFLVFGLVAGFRGTLRAVERSDRAAEADGV